MRVFFLTKLLVSRDIGKKKEMERGKGRGGKKGIVKG